MSHSPNVIPKDNLLARSEFRDMFCGVMWVAKEEGIKIEDYMKEFDKWELLDNDKNYTRKTIRDIHNGQIREYKNYVCIMDDGKTETLYVVYKRILKS